MSGLRSRHQPHAARLAPIPRRSPPGMSSATLVMVIELHVTADSTRCHRVDDRAAVAS
jgi:hypothetical protein